MRKSLNPLIYNGFKAFCMVGVTGFEPMASWSRTKRDTKLRHTPKCFSIILYRSDKIKWYFDFLLNVFNF